MNSKTIIFIGPQGSGKGTQLEALRDYFESHGEEVSVFQTGEMFRTLQEKNSFVAWKVRETLDAGTHQPLVLSVSLWGHVLTKYSDPEKHHLIDGFPRRLEEAKLLDEMLDFCERKPVDVILFEISNEEAKRRMEKRGRADDTDGGITKRVEFYKTHTAPIVDYYDEHESYSVHRIDAEQTPEEVTKDIAKVLNL